MNNIIYILLDQVRKDMLGTYGHQVVKTPNLDRLAKDGIRFNNAFTPASVCGPARTSLFTGLMPSSHGIIKNGEKGGTGEIPQQNPNIAGVEGYNSFVIGNGTLVQNPFPKIMASPVITLTAMATRAAKCIKTSCLISRQHTPTVIVNGWRKRAMTHPKSVEPILATIHTCVCRNSVVCFPAVASRQ